MRTLRSFVSEFPGVFRPAGVSFDAVEVSDLKLDLGYTPVKDIKVIALHDRFWAEPQDYPKQRLSGFEAQEILSKGNGSILMGGGYTFFSIGEDHKFAAYGPYPGCVRAHEVPRLISLPHIEYWEQISLRDVIMAKGFEPERILEEFGEPQQYFMGSDYTYELLSEWHREGIADKHLVPSNKWYAYENPAWFTYKFFQADLAKQRQSA